MIIDGKKIAGDILTKVHASVSLKSPVVRAVVVSPSPATESYLRIKTVRAKEAGMRLELASLADNATEAEVIAAITAPGADAVIVQMPLPPHLSPRTILSHIPIEKDADVLAPATYEAFADGVMGALIPPVAGAVAEILRRAQVTSFENKKVVVVGNGKLVGQPVATWFSQQGVEPVVVDKESSGSLETVLKDADIIVSGVGQAGLIQPSMLKEGVVLIDAGTSESNGALSGDMDPRCAEKASVFTPVPGGVGPIAVALLFQNTAHLIDQ